MRIDSPRYVAIIASVVVTIIVFISLVSYLPLVVTLLVTVLSALMAPMAALGFMTISGANTPVPVDRADGEPMSEHEKSAQTVPLSGGIEASIYAGQGTPAAQEIANSFGLPLARIATPSALSGLAAHAAMVGAVPVWAASRIGKSHMADGQMRQDAFSLIPLGPNAVCAVADGLGSTRDAHAAANAAVVAATQSRWELTGSAEEWQTHANEIVAGIQAFIEANIESSDTWPEPSSTTLVIAAVVPDPTGTSTVYWLSVGDSAVMQFSAGADSFTFINTAPRDLAEGTHALPSTEPVIESGVFHLPAGDSCVLASDGGWNQLIAGQAHFSSHFRQLIATRADASHLLAMIQAEGQGFEDDATVVIMHNPGNGGSVSQ